MLVGNHLYVANVEDLRGSPANKVQHFPVEDVPPVLLCQDTHQISWTGISHLVCQTLVDHKFQRTIILMHLLLNSHLAPNSVLMFSDKRGPLEEEEPESEGNPTWLVKLHEIPTH